MSTVRKFSVLLAVWTLVCLGALLIQSGVSYLRLATHHQSVGSYAIAAWRGFPTALSAVLPFAALAAALGLSSRTTQDAWRTLPGVLIVGLIGAVVILFVPAVPVFETGSLGRLTWSALLLTNVVIGALASALARPSSQHLRIAFLAALALMVVGGVLVFSVLAIEITGLGREGPNGTLTALLILAVPGVTLASLIWAERVALGTSSVARVSGTPRPDNL